ncbi:hypothetical protein CLAFUW4_02532 [Fulvia fulva]|uniref:DUF7053 domain-containing protein n=1 Tax=Passalora fulva TaxID=5499 RepID=A0A9Q8LAS9_PASFU|nr:uncharacterized protein CLAFUR5_02522 [Fulvia fulva]KAK4631647.1 hypothetical protein CLAFUR4_02527 [Fulvia fulva]KAK4633402.1 hypothetical protein CLAFUR0_02531 [Fulvia fulva]UJO14076.1 hypothetical protein CLAFUR5_02522 [Fulvia fulva]WPV11917.1 hypothetical protein CLAFUW4_02532 [Fulvia fulva]WPV25887.1 hypothetical protein CLAFUW7_02532 [Fulvia fulva]
MFETTFQHTTNTPLPANVSIESGIEILHDCETILRLAPDCRDCRPIPPPESKNGQPKPNDDAKLNSNDDTTEGETQHWEVEDDLPFIPKRLWSGGVTYRCDFVPTHDGCIITVYAPGGFTSINRWRLLREAIPEEGEATLEKVQSKDLLHATTDGSGWFVQIQSDAKCNRTFAGFVKGFLKNSHLHLHKGFIEKLQASPAQQRSRRPTIGRSNSSEF